MDMTDRQRNYESLTVLNTGHIPSAKGHLIATIYETVAQILLRKYFQNIFSPALDFYKMIW
jgi:hypothetical protein